MTPASFSLIVGLVYCALGILGFLPQAAPDALLLGFFRTNALLSLLHLVTGLWGLAAWGWMAPPVSYARAMTVIYGALAAIAMLWDPLRGHNVWLHGITALVSAYFGWFFLSSRLASHSGRAAWKTLERRRNAAERRRASVLVAHERRRNAGDRRLNQPSTLPAG
jgi:uncharacterized protein DUF4383